MATIREQLDIPSDFASRLGKEAVQITQDGAYISANGVRVEIRESVRRSRQGTITYAPADHLPVTGHGQFTTRIEVVNQTTLTAAQALIDEGYSTAALNFASATSPGGGFLHGARAQEEYLCRSSSLYESLYRSPMYLQQEFHHNPFYADYVIYSPDVIVFRNDDHALLDEPYPLSILTSPAVHAKAVKQYMPERLPMIERAMASRVLKVLAAARHHGHDALVLGAWGCGAFGNDGHVIAGLFEEALSGNFKGAFAQVMFAVTDWSPEERFIGPFYEVFGGRG
jgi:uncharacterized protein (TIGR02452 family)